MYGEEEINKVDLNSEAPTNKYIDRILSTNILLGFHTAIWAIYHFYRFYLYLPKRYLVIGFYKIRIKKCINNCFTILVNHCFDSPVNLSSLKIFHVWYNNSKPASLSPTPLLPPTPHSSRLCSFTWVRHSHFNFQLWHWRIQRLCQETRYSSSSLFCPFLSSPPLFYLHYFTFIFTPIFE